MNSEIIPVSTFSNGSFTDEGIFAEANEPALTLWQLPAQTQTQMNSYVIRTAGNEVIVIDGGTKGDASYLHKFIKRLGNHVNAWFISHPHLDHADALTEILGLCNQELTTMDVTNNQSAVWRVDACGKSKLFLGDLAEDS